MCVCVCVCVCVCWGAKVWNIDINFAVIKNQIKE